MLQKFHTKALRSRSKGRKIEGTRSLDDAPVWEGEEVAPGVVPEGVVVVLDEVDEVQLAKGQVRLLSSCLLEYTDGVVYTARSKSDQAQPASC